MSKSRFFFLYLFVGLLAISAFQFFLLENSDLDCVSMVEEQQETFGQSVEVIGEDFKTPKFEVYSQSNGENFDQNHSIIHIDKDYPPIHLPVPYSPPELI